MIINNHRIFFLIATSLFFSNPSFAYIGPGMAGGVLAAIIGVIVSLFLAFFGVLYFPIKRALQKRKNRKNDRHKERD